MSLDEQISTLSMAAPPGSPPLTALMASPRGRSPPRYCRPSGAKMRDTPPSLVGEGTCCWTQPWASPTPLGPACLTRGKTGAKKMPQNLVGGRVYGTQTKAPGGDGSCRSMLSTQGHSQEALLCFCCWKIKAAGSGKQDLGSAESDNSQEC